MASSNVTYASKKRHPFLFHYGKKFFRRHTKEKNLLMNQPSLESYFQFCSTNPNPPTPTFHTTFLHILKGNPQFHTLILFPSFNISFLVFLFYFPLPGTLSRLLLLLLLGYCQLRKSTNSNKDKVTILKKTQVQFSQDS